MSELKELIKRVKSLNEEKKYGEVIVLLSDDILGKYHDSDLYVEKAQAYLMTNMVKSFDSAIGIAIQINPRNFRAHLHCGNRYLIEKNYDKAIDSYNKSIDINPTYAQHFMV